MRILGVDQSFKKTGLVVRETNNPDMIHCELFKALDITDNRYKAAVELAKRIKKIVDDYNVDKVCIEELSYGSMGNNTRDLGGLFYIVMVHLTVEHNTDVQVVNPKTLKKWATGRGNAKKEEMIDAVPQEIKNIFGDNLGCKKTTGLDDMCDAYHLAGYGLEE